MKLSGYFTAALIFTILCGCDKDIHGPTVDSQLGAEPPIESTPIVTTSGSLKSKSAGADELLTGLGEEPECCSCPPAKPGKYSRTDDLVFTIPNVELRDQHDQQVGSIELFAHEGPVIVQFFFTSCSTLCPVLTSSLSAAQSQMGVHIDETLVVSISIDPNHDSPDKLFEFASQFRTSRNWKFLTGNETGIRQIQTAFDAYQQNKMRHLPLTFFRAAKNSSWTRVDGLLSGEAMASEFLKTVAKEKHK